MPSGTNAHRRLRMRAVAGASAPPTAPLCHCGRDADRRAASGAAARPASDHAGAGSAPGADGAGEAFCDASARRCQPPHGRGPDHDGDFDADGLGRVASVRGRPGLGRTRHGLATPCVRRTPRPRGVTSSATRVLRAPSTCVPERGRLSARRASAAAAAAHIAQLGISRIGCRPMGGGGETAAAVVAATGHELEIWDWIHELREPPSYYAMSASEQQRHRWSNRMLRHADDPTDSPDGGESFAELLGRVERAHTQLVADDVDRTLVIGHGIFLRFTSCRRCWERPSPAHGGPPLANRIAQLRPVDVRPRGGEPIGEPRDFEGWRCVSWMPPCPGRGHGHRRQRSRELTPGAVRRPPTPPRPAPGRTRCRGGAR